METPTSFLPPLKRLDECKAPQIHKILTHLVTIYLPKVRGTAPIDEDQDSLQSDDFERSFTIRWLTGFIARGEEWIELYTDEEEPIGSGATATTYDSSIGKFQTEFLDDTYQARTTAFDRAAALLGACAGTSASGVISREFKFATSPVASVNDSTYLDPDSFITILLRDESISTGDHTAVGLQTWGSACILAERIARNPVAFGLPDVSAESLYNRKGARVLELGAGTGLLSLLAGKLVERAGATTDSDISNYTIVATDYHPAVLANLRANVQGNFSGAISEDDSLVDVRSLDWSLYLTGRPTTDLSRAPSTAPSPATGTPVSGCGQKCVKDQTSAIPSGIQVASVPGLAMSPPIQTPSLSVTSTVSTPATVSTPQTPQTPRTARSPPPNLARAVFSRLIARGLKFEMPCGPPGIDQNPELAKKSDCYPSSPNMDDEYSAHCFDSAPTTTNFDASVPVLDSDIPAIEVDQMIETRKLSPIQASGSLFPLGAPRSELLCANHQDKTIVSRIDSAGSNSVTSCLDEMGPFRLSDNMEVRFSPGEDQRPTSSQAPIGAPGNLAGYAGSLACLELSNKIMCLGNDSTTGDDAVGTGTPQFKIAGGTGGLAHDLDQRQAPHVPRPAIASTYPLGELCTPDTIDYESETGSDVRSYTEIGHVHKVNDGPSNSMLGGNANHAVYTRYCQAPSAPADPPFDQPFDVIFGADIVYELSHVTLVRGVVERLLRKPSHKPGAPPAYFHMIMPLRPTHADEANSVDMAFPRAEDIPNKEVGESEILAIVKTETYARSAGVGRADEVQYVHYRVGWV
ncbi:unnamed protein product [Rhizoctonia solani]|uniref:Uncharacterized protein n=1 Tax=Rhizoctonia solani TaxID=456999 RepID=A0A8H3BFU8_9AGAM|nr:unnamed protein product [Rhizoctonia solani]